MTENIVKKNTVILRQLGDRNQEVAYGRFLDNDAVSRDTLIDGIVGPTSKACANKHVLHIEDSFQLNYDAVKDKVTGLGTITNGSKQGFFIHPVLAIDANYGGVLGISAFHAWNREDYSVNNKQLTPYQLSQLPIEQKESFRWIETAQNALDNCSSANIQTIITDREGDIYDTYLDLPDKTNDIHVLIRSSKDRLLYDEDINLFEYTDNLAVAHSYELDLPATDERLAHIAKLEVRFGTVKIARPKNFGDKDAPNYIELSVVDVRELDETVPNGSTAVHWRLLTTHKVETVEMAMLIIEWYC